MKKLIPILLVLAVFTGVFVYSVNYRNEANQKQFEIAAQRETKKASKNDTPLTDEDIIAQNEESGYKLYYKDGKATVAKGDAKLEFNNWSNSIDAKNPELYYNDFDSDGEKELIIRLADGRSDVTGKTEYDYVLYLFEETEKDGKKQLTYITANANSWRTVFKNSINFELTQLKCKKFLQIAMNDADNRIEYDEETGITDNKYVAYALANSNSKKEFYTLSKYSSGLGIYNISEDGKITLDIRVIINYTESELNYYIGNIHSEIVVSDGYFRLKPNTIVFNPLESYTVTDPRDTATADWSYEIKNLSSSDGNGVISSITAQFTVGSGTGSSLYLGSYSGDITDVDSVKFTQSSVTLTAKNGFTFDENVVKNGKFKVLAGQDRTDISYTAQVKNSSDGSTLIIDFDKSYDREDLSSVIISYGI
ncbi:MAG: hypothetical protein ACI4RF_02710 [Eubacterium sp.]